ncbi:chymotrypsinogen A-like [Clytia hemisphaerica]|uniref:Peptidase S1 domain-containing protein n=1 Tax=Clytia hemisphaerica TaxID=252671 RepID=A0A7M5WQN7_9CNID
MITKFLLILGLAVLGAFGAESRCFDMTVRESCENMKTYFGDMFCKNPVFYQNTCKLFCKSCKPDESGAELNSKCGISKVLTNKPHFHRVRRVVHGNNAKEGSFPWLASLSYFGKHFCGGALIDRQWVLTAAHCIDEDQRGDYRKVVSVDLGVHHQSNILKNPKFERFSIKRVIKYPGFPNDLSMLDYSKLKDDIALIQLDRPAALNDRVGTVCLPKKGVYPKVGTKCILAGWGYTNWEKKTDADIVQQTFLPIAASDKPHPGCHNNPKVMCFGEGFNAKNPTGCRGDSGGPMICQDADGRWVAEGVNSYLHSYCKYFLANAPVNQYIDWIHKQMNTYK